MRHADSAMCYASVEELAKQVKQSREQFDEMRKNLASLKNNLTGLWQGKSRSLFISSYEDLEIKLESISEVLGNYADEFALAVEQQKEEEFVREKGFSELSIYNGF